MIVETLKAFRIILLGNRINVYTDHKILTYVKSDFPSDRILRQRLIIEEYGAKFACVKGDTNVVANTLSRLLISNHLVNDSLADEELFLFRRVFEDQIPFPMDLSRIAELQKDDL